MADASQDPGVLDRRDGGASERESGKTQVPVGNLLQLACAVEAPLLGLPLTPNSPRYKIDCSSPPPFLSTSTALRNSLQFVLLTSEPARHPLHHGRKGHWRQPYS